MDPLNNQSIVWEDLIVRLTAYADSLIKTKACFKVKREDSAFQGKQPHDYAMAAIEEFILKPGNFDPAKDRSLINYLKLHILRRLISNDAKSSENRRATDLSSILVDREKK